MLKRLLLSSIILSSIGLSAQAIDINIPGADLSVASNAYENYVFIKHRESTFFLRLCLVT